MTLAELLEKEAAHPGAPLLRSSWCSGSHIEVWQGHLWAFIDNSKVAPWCPTPSDILATDWHGVDA